MNSFQDLIQQTAVLEISNLSADFIIKSLKVIGLTDDDIKKFNQCSIKLSWILGLEGYSKNCTLPLLIKNVLQLSIIEIKDDKIYNSIPKDIIKGFFDLCKRLDKSAAKQNMDLKEFLKDV